MKLKSLFAAIYALVFVTFGAASLAGAQTEDAAQVAAGEEVYASSCSGCHGANGEGSDNGRPLTGIAAQEPDRTVHIMSVTDGKGSMPAFGDRLSEDEIDAAVAFVRATFVSEADDLPRTGSDANLLLAGGLGLMAFGLFASRAGSLAIRRE